MHDKAFCLLSDFSADEMVQFFTGLIAVISKQNKLVSELLNAKMWDSVNVIGF